MAEAISWFYHSSSWILTAILVVFAAALLINFFNKRTTGTLMLFRTYLFFALARILLSIAYTMQLAGIKGNSVGIIQVLASSLGVSALIFLYVFAGRHTLKEPEALKTLLIFLFSAGVGAITSLLIFDIAYFPVEERVFTNITKPSADLTMTSPIYIIVAIMAVIQTFIFFRIIVRSFILSSRTDQKIRKRGFQLIGWGLILFFSGVLLEAVLYSANIENTSTIFAIWIIRNLIFLVSYIIMYLGWVMPDWFRKRLRVKTWIENELKIIHQNV